MTISIITRELVLATTPCDNFKKIVAGLISTPAKGYTIIVSSILCALKFRGCYCHAEVSVLVTSIEGQGNVMRELVLNMVLVVRKEKCTAGWPIAIIFQIIVVNISWYCSTSHIRCSLDDVCDNQTAHKC